jgi:hypothetical protein
MKKRTAQKLKLEKIKIASLNKMAGSTPKGDNRSTNTLFAVCSQICASARCSFEC